MSGVSGGQVVILDAPDALLLWGVLVRAVQAGRLRGEIPDHRVLELVAMLGAPSSGRSSAPEVRASSSLVSAKQVATEQGVSGRWVRDLAARAGVPIAFGPRGEKLLRREDVPAVLAQRGRAA